MSARAADGGPHDPTGGGGLDADLDGVGTARDELIERLVAAWLHLARAGAAPPIPVYAEAHPDVARELAQYLPSAALLEGLGARLVEAARVGDAAARHGERLGDFRLLGVLGRGGMGVVYEALDEKLGRHVALKVLPDSRLGDRRSRERFQREAQAAARLHHRCIVPVHGVGESDGQHWFAMQRIDGVGLDLLVRAVANEPELGALDDAQTALARDLAARFLAGPLGVHDVSGEASAGSSGASLLHAPRYANAARISRDAAEALAHAHAAGVQHRDVKPSNVMLDRRGHVWVADFGLCKSAEHGSVTTVGDVVGTLRYMPPERLRGVETPQGDIYGLGLVLYELVTLRPAFPPAQRAELARQVGYEEPPRPSRVAPDVPRDLERIIFKAIAKLPEERYPSVEALARDLGAFLDGRPVSARPIGALYLARLFVRRNRALVTLASCAAALLVLASLVYVVGLHRLVRDLDAARAATDAEASRARLAAAGSALDAGRFLLARGFLDDVPLAHHDWLVAHLAHRARSGGQVFGAGEGRVRALVELAVDDASALAVVRAGSITVHALADGEALARIEVPDPTSVQAFDGGRRLAWVGPDGGVVHAWDWRAGAEPAPLPEFGNDVRAFAADVGAGPGARAAVVRGADALEVVDLATGVVVASTPLSVAPRHHAAAAAGLALIAAEGAGAYLVDLHAGAITALACEPGEVAGPALLTADLALVGLRGNRYATLRLDAPLALQDRAAGLRVAALGLDAARGRVLLGNFVGNVFEARRGRGRNELLGQLHSSAVTAILALGDGARVATACDGGEVRIGDANVATDGQAGVDSARVHTAPVTALDSSADGALAISGDAAGGLVVWDLEATRPLADAAALAPGARDIDLAADGAAALVAGPWTRLWRLDGLREPGSPVVAPTVLPVGATLACCIEDPEAGTARRRGLLIGTDGALVRCALDDGAVVARAAAAEGDLVVAAAAISKDGKRCAVASADGRVFLRAAAGAADLVAAGVWTPLGTLRGAARDLAFDDAGDALAVVDTAGHLTTFLCEGGAWRPGLDVIASEPGGLRNAPSQVVFGRDGRWLVTATDSGAVMTWWRDTGAPGVRLLQTWSRCGALAAPRAGAPLVLGDEFGRVSVFRVAPPLARAAPTRPLGLEDSAALIAAVQEAADGGEAALCRPALALAEGLRRRVRFGRLELDRAAREALDAAAEVLGASAGDGVR